MPNQLVCAMQQEEQLPAPITICFVVASLSTHNKCLGFIDPSSATWQCQDRALWVEGDMLCGSTPHLTNFAILLLGSFSNGHQYMFSSFWYDLALVLPLACLIIAIIIVTAFVLRRIDRQREHNDTVRMAKRMRMKDLGNGDTSNNYNET